MKKESKIKVAITIDKSIIERIDEIVVTTNSNRSEFINLVLKSVLGGIKK